MPVRPDAPTRRDRAVPALLTALLVTAGATGSVAGAGPARAADAPVVVTGHGYGHGRGLGQWGALGYAVAGWSSAQILDHYYGGTTPAAAPDLPISVELLAQRGRGAILQAPGLTVNGVPLGSAAVMVVRSAPGVFTVQTGPGCAGPWTPWGTAGPGPVLASSVTPVVELCEASQIRGYRGDMQLVERSDGQSALLNRLPVESYLRGVVPRESSASWADLGGGRGAQALQAQAVAARSYALASPYASYATACDSTVCQVYAGAYTRPSAGGSRTVLDDPRSDAAVAATAGLVRRTAAGRTARTEFSASTGGWTAGGEFPAVEDAGDAYAGNPVHDWSVSFSPADLAARLGLGPLTGLRVTSRTGLGADGGRVLQVVADTARGPVALTGNDVRQRLGLRSDWFSLPTRSYAESQSLVRGMWADLLGRAPGTAELAARSGELAGGRPVADLARDLATSQERSGHLVDDAYRGALLRSAGDAERAGWGATFRASGSLVELRAGVYGSAESLAVAGGTPESWVALLYRGVLGREPSAGERAGWGADAQRRGQAAVVRDVAGSAEALSLRLGDYYAELLQRTPDPGSGGFATALRGSGEISVPVGIAASPEYAAKTALRFPA